MWSETLPQKCNAHNKEATKQQFLAHFMRGDYSAFIYWSSTRLQSISLKGNHLTKRAQI